MNRDCKIHGNTKHFKRNDSQGYRCYECASIAVVKSRIKKKETLVNMYGGKCIRCNYNKYYGALDFHHIDASTKSFGISAKLDYSLARLLKEAEKCILVCANCHREIHIGL